MKKKQKVDMGIAVFLILIGVILLILPLFNIDNIKWLNTGIFALYTILNSIQFILTKESKDYEGLHSALASVIVLIANIVITPIDSPKTLAMLLMAWIIFMSLAKLKKMDYYHDRRDRMWKIRAFNLSLFILAGVLASINLAYDGVVQVLVIGFFMLIHGILELFDPVVKTLIAHS
ncbi:MAG: hypothetical protein K2H20_04100 [Bacilli bacterium]|nr:hypothetical protein [Bacilli bacterium]